MSNSQEKVSNKQEAYLKRDLLFFLLLVLVFVGAVVSLFIWDKNTDFLERISAQLIEFIGI